MPSRPSRRLAVPAAPVRAQQLELFGAPDEPPPSYGMAVPPWCGLAAWHHELDRQTAIMRPRTPLYHRFEATARQLTREHIRGSRDVAAIARLVTRLSAARYPTGDLHGLERVWSRADLGTLIVEATNRQTLLGLGATRPGPRGRRSTRAVCPATGSTISYSRTAISTSWTHCAPSASVARARERC